jgi:hypothetical protein
MRNVPPSYPSGLKGATLSKVPPAEKMKLHRTSDSISIELPFAEAKVLFDELAHVRGGARLPKLRQVCHELEAAFELEASKTKVRKLRRVK